VGSEEGQGQGFVTTFFDTVEKSARRSQRRVALKSAVSKANKCAICGHKLTDPESKRLGIGPSHLDATDTRTRQKVIQWMGKLPGEKFAELQWGGEQPRHAGFLRFMNSMSEAEQRQMAAIATGAYKVRTKKAPAKKKRKTPAKRVAKRAVQRVPTPAEDRAAQEQDRLDEERDRPLNDVEMAEARQHVLNYLYENNAFISDLENDEPMRSEIRILLRGELGFDHNQAQQALSSFDADIQLERRPTRKPRERVLKTLADLLKLTSARRDEIKKIKEENEDVRLKADFVQHRVEDDPDYPYGYTESEVDPITAARAEAIARLAWTVEHGGMWSEIKKIVIGSETYVSGVIHAEDEPDENGIGTFTRTIDEDGEVHHEYLSIWPNWQGHGFAEAFNTHAENYYVAAGLTKIHVHADIDVGGYAWARKGFDFSAESRAAWWRRLDGIVEQRTFYDRETGKTETISDELVNEIRDLLLNPDMTAFEVSELGASLDESFGDGHHFGKAIMLGSDWYGVKDLAPLEEFVSKAALTNAEKLFAIGEITSQWLKVRGNNAAFEARHEDSDYNEHSPLVDQYGPDVSGWFDDAVSKARDGDGDGYVYDGTPKQRPATPAEKIGYRPQLGERVWYRHAGIDKLCEVTEVGRTRVTLDVPIRNNTDSKPLTVSIKDIRPNQRVEIKPILSTDKRDAAERQRLARRKEVLDYLKAHGIGDVDGEQLDIFFESDPEDIDYYIEGRRDGWSHEEMLEDLVVTPMSDEAIATGKIKMGKPLPVELPGAGGPYNYAHVPFGNTGKKIWVIVDRKGNVIPSNVVPIDRPKNEREAKERTRLLNTLAQSTLPKPTVFRNDDMKETTTKIKDFPGARNAYITADGLFVIANTGPGLWTVYRMVTDDDIDTDGPGLPWAKKDVNAIVERFDDAWYVEAWSSPTKSDAIFEIQRDERQPPVEKCSEKPQSALNRFFFGKAGKCKICGTTLTDPKSIALGIGKGHLKSKNPTVMAQVKRHMKNAPASAKKVAAEEGFKDTTGEKRVYEDLRAKRTGKRKSLPEGMSWYKPADAERVKKAARPIPPGWSDVVVAKSMKAKVLAHGFDSKGRPQAIYHPAFRASQDAKKFKRIRDIAKKMPKLDAAIEKYAMDDSVYAALLIVRTMGFRAGGEGRSQTEYQAVGASNIRKEHVKVGRGKVTFTFTGKMGKPLVFETNDKFVVSVVQAYMDFDSPVKGDEDFLWGYFDDGDGNPVPAVDNFDMLDVVKEHLGPDAKTHDLRTTFATEYALQLLAEYALPEDEKEEKAIKKEVATLVGEAIGDTATVALNSYISPTVWDLWK
jgi:DNA topoisomerase-1